MLVLLASQRATTVQSNAARAARSQLPPYSGCGAGQRRRGQGSGGLSGTVRARGSSQEMTDSVPFGSGSCVTRNRTTRRKRSSGDRLEVVDHDEGDFAADHGVLRERQLLRHPAPSGRTESDWPRYAGAPILRQRQRRRQFCFLPQSHDLNSLAAQTTTVVVCPSTEFDRRGPTAPKGRVGNRRRPIDPRSVVGERHARRSAGSRRSRHPGAHRPRR